MRAPRKAFILAAGFGTRLRPLTETTPKPMLPLWGRPMLDRTLEMLASWGVRDVLVNLHHAPGPIVRHLAAHPVAGLRVSAVFEPEILGTGGALRNAAWFLDKPFWLLNADIVADLDPRDLLRAWRAHRPLAACWLTEKAGPRTVRCQKGRIRSFHDPRRGHATFCGLQLLDPRILPYIRPTGFDTIIDAYRRAQKKGHCIAGVCVPGSFWADIGTPAQYVQAHHDTAGRFGRTGKSFTLPAAIALSLRERNHLSLSGQEPVEILPPRGSNRAFFRLPPRGSLSDHVYKHGRFPAILVRWSPERPENRLYARHTRFLDGLGIPVPQLRLDDPRDHLIVMEDLGRETLQDRLPGMSPEAASRIYCRLLDITLHLHREGLSAARRSRLRLMPGFGPDLYRWEHGYFIQHILQDRLHAAGKTIAAVAADLQKTARRLAASPTALIHRDWQSSNVLFRGRQPVMIDFQGMRRGPAAYDLASLLCDPYADLPADLQTRLLRRYAGRLSCGHAVAAAFPAAAVQRLCQALGAYANLSRNPGMETFAGHIPAAARQLLRALDVFSCPALRRVACRLAGS